jgi:hypothetical protein
LSKSLNFVSSGNRYSLYGEHNKPTASDVGAVPAVNSRVTKFGFDSENDLHIVIDGVVYKMPFGYGHSDALMKTGGTMTGALVVPKVVMTDYDSPIEIGRFIDMHLAGSTNDYDARLELNANGLYLANVNGKAGYLYGEHNITKGTTSLTAGTSALGNGCIHLVYD